MARQFIRLLVDVHCEWKDSTPIYRAYVNDELFAERTWIWTDMYLEECFQIEAEPGEYRIRYELVEPHYAAEITATNFRVDHGPATIEDNIVRILDETV
jgi:hypothetical protein